MPTHVFCAEALTVSVAKIIILTCIVGICMIIMHSV